MEVRVGVCIGVSPAGRSVIFVGERPGACVGRGVGAGGYKPIISSFFCWYLSRCLALANFFFLRTESKFGARFDLLRFGFGVLVADPGVLAIIQYSV